MKRIFCFFAFLMIITACGGGGSSSSGGQADDSAPNESDSGDADSGDEGDNDSDNEDGNAGEDNETEGFSFSSVDEAAKLFALTSGSWVVSGSVSQPLGWQEKDTFIKDSQSIPNKNDAATSDCPVSGRFSVYKENETIESPIGEFDFLVRVTDYDECRLSEGHYTSSINKVGVATDYSGPGQINHLSLVEKDQNITSGSIDSFSCSDCSDSGWIDAFYNATDFSVDTSDYKIDLSLSGVNSRYAESQYQRSESSSQTMVIRGASGEISASGVDSSCVLPSVNFETDGVLTTQFEIVETSLALVNVQRWEYQNGSMTFKTSDDEVLAQFFFPSFNEVTVTVDGVSKTFTSEQIFDLQKFCTYK
jgi:hypothetical protein